MSEINTDKLQAELRIYHELEESISSCVSRAKNQRITTTVDLTPEQRQLLTALVDSLVETYWSDNDGQ